LLELILDQVLENSMPPRSFRERMMLQMRVIEAVVTRMGLEPLEAAEKIAPIYAEKVPHIA
jgi:hypothetical protein